MRGGREEGRRGIPRNFKAQLINQLINQLSFKIPRRPPALLPRILSRRFRPRRAAGDAVAAATEPSISGRLATGALRLPPACSAPSLSPPTRRWDQARRGMRKLGPGGDGRPKSIGIMALWRPALLLLLLLRESRPVVCVYGGGCFRGSRDRGKEASRTRRKTRAGFFFTRRGLENWGGGV